MKKIITLLAAMAIMGTCAFAQEIESETAPLTAVTEETAAASATENVRLDILIGDTVSTNTLALVNTTNLGLRLGLKENQIGVILGGMFREGFDLADIEYGFPLDFYWSANPYIGIELWDVEILGGVAFSSVADGPSVYAGIFYLFELIKQQPGFNDRLTLKAGVDYNIDMFTGKYINDRRTDTEAIGTAFVDLFSMLIPKVSVGVQYSFGWGF